MILFSPGQDTVEEKEALEWEKKYVEHELHYLDLALDFWERRRADPQGVTDALPNLLDAHDAEEEGGNEHEEHDLFEQRMMEEEALAAGLGSPDGSISPYGAPTPYHHCT